MTRLEWRIAFRYLRSRRASRAVSLITLIATGGVTVGVMALVVVMGVMNGLQNELRDRILIASPHLRIATYGAGLRIDDWRAVLDSIRTHPRVVAASPTVFSQGLITAGADFAEGVSVIGLDADTGSVSVLSLPRHFLRGDLTFSFERDDVEGGVIVGNRVGQRLGAFPGDRLTIISAAGTRYNRSLGGFIPRALSYEVIGDFETGMYEYDNNYVILSLEAAQHFAELDSAISLIDVRLDDPWIAPEVGVELETLLGYPFRFIDWQTQNASLFSALKLEKLAMGLILLLIVLVAAFNIVSTLIMVVTDKTREIGILRAMGLSTRAVRSVFVLQGAIIGLIGTAVGSALGLIVATLVDRRQLIRIDPSVYFVDHLPVEVQAPDLVLIIVASLGVASLATIIPARRAAALTPVDAIRHE